MGQERESWGNHCEFFLSSLGLAVGLGNVWRFPYVCYSNGGGTFLIPYIAMLVFVGLPAFFLELSLGQYSRVGANKVFGRMVPAFKGLGYAMIVVRFFVNIYYVVITAWALFYLAMGFTSELPWKSCEESYNTFACYSKSYEESCKSAQGNDTTWYAKRCVSYEEYCQIMDKGQYNLDTTSPACQLANGTLVLIKDIIGETSVSPAEDYFNGRVLGLTKNEQGDRYSWDDYGSMQGHLVGCLAGSWVLICLTLIKGIQSYGKIAYVITLSPYFVLTLLLVYTAGWLEGASDGLAVLFDPDWSTLLDANIWARAASQILFSLSVAFGSQLVLSSYNNFKNNSHRDSIIVGLCNSLTSLYAGIVVFLILGFLAKNQESTVDQVVKAGITLAFVSYPSAVLEMGVAPLWSFLFFFMLINLALSSICGGVQTFLAFIIDEKPSLAKYRTYLVIGICACFFLAGLPMTTNGGILLFTVFDKRCTSSLLFVCILEIVHVAWFYGTDKFFDNLTEMSMDLNKPLRWMWMILWKFVTPIILTFVTVLSWINHEPMTYDEYQFPSGIEALGWIMELAPLIIVLLYPIIPFYRAWNEGFRGKELYDELFKPTEKWYSAQMERRQEELKAVEDSKYYHHNLGYDDDDYMKAGGDVVAKPPAYEEVIKKADLEEIESLPEANVFGQQEEEVPKILVNDQESKAEVDAQDKSTEDAPNVLEPVIIVQESDKL